MSEKPAAGTRPAASMSHADRLSTLFESHSDRLYRLARRMAPSSADALDLVQETFLKAAQSLKSVPSESSGEEAWLVRVLINIRRDQWRKEAIRRRFTPSHPAVVAADSERELVVRSLVWGALDSLSPRRRAVVVMFELEGRTIAAIASLLGIRAVTVRWHLSRGRRELARQIRLDLGDSNERVENAPAEHGSDPARSPTR